MSDTGGAQDCSMGKRRSSTPRGRRPWSDNDGEQVDGIEASEAGDEEFVEIGAALEVALVAVEEDEAGEHEGEGDAEFAVLEKDGDGVRHVGAGGEGGSEMKGHNADSGKEAYAGESVEAASADAFAWGGAEAFVEELLGRHAGIKSEAILVSNEIGSAKAGRFMVEWMRDRRRLVQAELGLGTVLPLCW